MGLRGCGVILTLKNRFFFIVVFYLIDKNQLEIALADGDMLFLYIDKKTLLSHPLNIQQIFFEIQVEFLERIVLLIDGLLVEVGENVNDFKHRIL